MASTYSNNLGLEIITTGEKSGTWGDITNGNLEILDAAVHGNVEIDLTGEGASYDLETDEWLSGGTTVYNGSYRLITFTNGDDPAPASRITINITPATSTKIYFVRANGVSYGLTISQGSGASTVDLDDGDAKVIWCDGNNNVYAFSDDLTMSSVDITGGSIDGVAIGANSTSTGAFTTIDVSGGVGSEIDNTAIGAATPSTGAFTGFTVTGSGSSFSVNPATAGTLNNVSLGATTRAAGNFTTLDADSTLTVTGVATFNGNVDLGSDSSDTVSFVGRIDTDILPTGTVDLGSTDNKFTDLHIDGIAYVDDIHAADCDINGGAIDGVIIGANSATEATFTDVTASTLTVNSISAGNIYEQQTSPALTLGTFTLNANDGSMFVCSHNSQTGPTFAFTNVPATGNVYTATIIHTYTGGTAMSGMTFPSGTEWPNATQPSPPGPGETDIYTIFTYDGGSTWYAGLSGANLGEPT